MAVPATTDELLELVCKSGLVSSDKLAPYRNGHPALPSVPRDAVKVLVGSGILTSFQGQNLLNGRWKGMVIGPYRVLGHLGSGGMGSVFLADHTLLDRKVALKVLGADKAKDQSFLERFYREARAGAALDHPNIVGCHDVCREKDLHFIVFEYVAGKSLQQVIDALGGLPFQQAADYITQACRGLQHAYERGIIHRDIKPGNLILDKSGFIKVLDMGLARFDSPKVGQNITERLDAGAVLGTADYLSPEQAMNSHEVDIRTDIYSMGATLYALLTGSAPFSKITSLTEKLMAHQMRTPAPIASVRPGVPLAMVEIVDAMMAKKPQDRPSTPDEVIELLRPLLDGSSVGNFAVGSTILRNRETLREPVKNPGRPALKTQIAPNSALPAPMPGLSRVPKKVRIAGGVALVAVVAGLALGLMPSERTPSKVAPVDVVKIDPPTQPESRAVDPVRPDRVAKFRKIYDLELPTTAVQPGRRKLRKSGSFDIVGTLPPNMYTAVYTDDATGEFAVEMEGSGLIMGIRNLDQLVAAQIGLKMPSGVENYKLDRTYRLVLEYRTTGGVRPIVHCRGDGDRGWEHETRFVLPASEAWNRIERDWKSDVPAQPLLVFGLADKGPNEWLYLRWVAIYESE